MMIARLFKYVETASVLLMVSVGVIALNHTIKTGEISPDIVPLITLYEHDDKRIYPEVYQHEEDVLNEIP
tara:strand:- start:630 stop:839 length:210 start_codon:yes stop_codon:yes gene_type:complete